MRLPTLTLFTKTRGCQLCEEAKDALARVHARAPFHERLYPIDAQADDDEQAALDRRAWRRLYQYDVPVLAFSRDEGSFDALSGRLGPTYGGRVFKHRIDEEELARLVRRWTQEMNDDD